MKILVTDACGTLAKSLISNALFKDDEFILVDKKDILPHIHKIDISNFRMIDKLIGNTLPDIIFHFAAETDVDLCETEKISCVNNNYVATKNLVDIAKELDIPFVFTSSASIFGDEHLEFLKEDAIPKPQNFYGTTKLFSENYIVSKLQKYWIFRFGWLIGDPSTDKKFMGKIYHELRKAASEITGVIDQFGSLTFADSFIEDLRLLLALKEYGIFHYASTGKTNRFEMIRNLLAFRKLESTVALIPVSISEFNLKAMRPKYEVIDSSKIKLLGAKNITDWETEYKKYLEKYFTF